MTKVRLVTKKEFIELEKKLLLGTLTPEEEKLYNDNKEEFVKPLQPTKDNIHPEHYKGKVQPIDLIDAHDLNFNIGNVIKYCTRYQRKGDPLSDLKKAQYYLNREIEKLQNK